MDGAISRLHNDNDVVISADSRAWSGPNVGSLPEVSADTHAADVDVDFDVIGERSIAEQPTCASTETTPSGWILVVAMFGILRRRRRRTPVA